MVYWTQLSQRSIGRVVPFLDSCRCSYSHCCSGTNLTFHYQSQFSTISHQTLISAHAYAKDPYPSIIKRLKVLNMTEKGADTNSRSNHNPVRFDLARFLRWLGISFVIVGWGIPLIIGILGPALPYSVREPIREMLSLINNEYRWIPASMAVIGLLGFPMFAISTVYIRTLSRFRLHFILVGFCTSISIACLSLVVDSQPPGSALAMLVSVMGLLLVPLAVLGIAVGLIGLLMLLPSR